MDAGTALEKLGHDFGTSRNSGKMNGSVSGVICGVEELVTFAFQELLDDLDVVVLNGVTESCECGFNICEAG